MANNRRCARKSGHKGKCNHIREFHRFWDNSPVQLHHVKVGLEKDVNTTVAVKANLANELLAVQDDVDKSIETLAQLQKNKTEQKKELEELTECYKKLSVMLEQKGYSRKRRENTSTT